jgi:NAD(P)-dependent dehydrogenase (short-subunit alcohol dehydrogenase family)
VKSLSRGKGNTEVVVVTGASAGVGRAIAREFARHGAKVGLLARSQDGLDGAARDVERLGGRASAVATDVSDDRQVEEAADRIERALGPIDIWVNNAMVSVLSPALEMTAEEFRRVTEVTYLGYVHGTLSALRRMVPRDRGVVVQIGSALAYRAIPLQSAYCAAKHAVQGFTESLRSELIHDGSRVRLTTVQLPAVNTPQFSWIRRTIRSLSRRFTNPKSSHVPSIGRRTTGGVNSPSAIRPSRRFSATSSFPGCSIIIWRG